jgi:predicted aspartyl protease
VQPWFSCFNRSIGEPVLFLVDTGSTISFISELDAKRLGIDYSTLRKLPEKDWVTGIGGTLPLYRIDSECKLTLRVVTNGKHEYHVETLDHFDVVEVVVSDKVSREKVLSSLPSILGMDILRNFEFTASNDEAYIET